MAFTVDDFQDFVRLLAQHPEWRPELRRLVLSDDLLELPALVRELVTAQQRTEERVGRLEAAVTALIEAQRRTDERVGRLEAAVTALIEAQQRTDERLGRLEEQGGRIEAAVTRLIESQQRADERFREIDVKLAELTLSSRRTDRELAVLRGDSLERRYRERGHAYFAPVLRHARVLRADQIVDLLDAAVDAGSISEDDADEIRLADVIARGRRRDTAEETHLVVEVSVVIDRHDVERAADRAALLSRYRPAMAAVAGNELTTAAAALAAERGVWRVLDGRVGAPSRPRSEQI